VHHLAHFEVFGTVVLNELVGLILSDVFVEAEVRLIDGGVRRPGISFLKTAEENSSWCRVSQTTSS